MKPCTPLLLLLVMLHSLALRAQPTAPPTHAYHWVASWTAAPEGSNPHSFSLRNETFRAVVHVTLGGNAARLRLSNANSDEPVTIARAHLALRRSGAAIDAAAGRAITFHGQPGVTLPAHGDAVSDPITLAIPPQSDIAISFYIPGEVTSPTIHWTALQNSFHAPGDATAADDPPRARAVLSWPYLAGLDVDAAPPAAAIVAFGDSITDGLKSSIDANHRWPDYLAARLTGRNLAVVNQGIAGNRLLQEATGANRAADGPSGLSRFTRDALQQPGVRYAIVLEGINDIAQQHASAEALIAGFKTLIAAAHAHGVRIYLGTILPFAGNTLPRFYLPEKESVRQQVNQWIRAQHDADGIIDFEKAVRDPNRPTFLAAAYDSGDGLHPSDAGYQAMAQSIDLSLFP